MIKARRQVVSSKLYLYDWCPGDRRSRTGYMPQHTLVWEGTTGRRLPLGWLVHHINGVKSDNRPENLEAMSRSRHVRLHLGLPGADFIDAYELATESERLAWLDQHPGATDRELGLAWRITPHAAGRWRLRHGVPVRRSPRVAPNAQTVRNAELVRRAHAHESQTALAREYGVSRQRVGQIVAGDVAVPGRAPGGMIDGGALCTQGANRRTGSPRRNLAWGR